MLENLRATVEHADTGRSAHLVSGEREEIASHFLHIDRQVTRALRRVDQSQCADRARGRQRSATGLIVPSEFEMCVNANSFTSLVSNRIQLIQRERAVFIHGHETQLRAGSLRDQLPRHEIAVVFHFGEENHISSAKKFSAPGLRDQIDALGRAAREDDFIGASCAEICRHALPRFLVRFSRAGTQFVETAMHIGVVVLVIMPERIDHGARLLRCRRVIEIDQRMTVRFLIEDRKILADDTPIDFVRRALVHDQAICAHVARCATFFAQRKNALSQIAWTRPQRGEPASPVRGCDVEVIPAADPRLVPTS